jgi:hypothetical protein
MAGTASICDFKLVHVLILLCTFPEEICLEGLLHSCEGKFQLFFTRTDCPGQSDGLLTCAEIEGHKHTVTCFVINNHRIRPFSQVIEEDE